MAKGWKLSVECAYCPAKGTTATMPLKVVPNWYKAKDHVCPACEPKRLRALRYVRLHRALLRKWHMTH